MLPLDPDDAVTFMRSQVHGEPPQAVARLIAYWPLLKRLLVTVSRFVHPLEGGVPVQDDEQPSIVKFLGML